jgi:hypothetical protein
MSTRRIFKFRNASSPHVENDKFRNISMLERNEMFFSSFDELNDPFEAKVHIDSSNINNELKIAYINALRNKNVPNIPTEKEITNEYLGSIEINDVDRFANWIINSAKSDILKDLNHLKDIQYVYSLSLAEKNKETDNFPSPLPNMLMWAHYAEDFAGFCLEFEFHELKKSLESINNCKVYNAPINYVKHDLPKISLKNWMLDTINNSNVYGKEASMIAYTKQYCWKPENEIRFQVTEHGLKNYSPESLKAIYVSYKCAPEARGRIKSFISDKPWIKIFVVHLHHEKYQLGFFTIERAKIELNYDF